MSQSIDIESVLSLISVIKINREHFLNIPNCVWKGNTFSKMPTAINWRAIVRIRILKTKIGWREKARRMLLYASDINFHQAGDGRVSIDVVV